MGWWKNLFSRSKPWSRPIPCGWWAFWASQVAQYDGYRTLIYTGEGFGGRDHAQARAKIQGTWEWISVRSGRLEIVPCELKKVKEADTPSVFWDARCIVK